MTKRTWKLTPEQRDEIPQRYAAGESGPSLAKEYGITATNIYRLCESRGVPRRSLSVACRRLSLDQTVFDTITPESAYWVGFLMADGHIDMHEKWSGNPRINLVLAAKDGEHVEAFRSFLKSEHAITKYGYINENGARVDFWRISVVSPHMVKTLGQYGVVPCKTFKTQVFHLENDRHFWRGMIDGDGSLSISRGQPRVRFAGSKTLVNQFADYAHTLCDHNSTVIPHKNIYTVAIWSRYAVTVVRELYRDCTIALPRKLKIAQEIMARQN